MSVVRERMMGAKAHRPTAIHRGSEVKKCWCPDCYQWLDTKQVRTEEKRQWREDYERESAQEAKGFADEMRDLFRDWDS